MLALWTNTCQEKPEGKRSQTTASPVWGFVHHKYLPDVFSPLFFTAAWTGVKTENNTDFLLSSPESCESLQCKEQLEETGRARVAPGTQTPLVRKMNFLKGKLLQNKEQEPLQWPRALNTHPEWKPQQLPGAETSWSKPELVCYLLSVTSDKRSPNKPSSSICTHGLPRTTDLLLTLSIL